MPQQKDLKRIVRSRMQKTGESYTTARMHVVKPRSEPQPKIDVSLAGMADEKVQAATGRNWTEWVAVLDAFDGLSKPHIELARYVSSLGVRDWWSQTVVVGYERIRGLRAIGQRRSGTWEASRSRTFAVPLATLFEAVAEEQRRATWLTGVTITRAASTKNRSVRIRLDDGSDIDFRFTPKGAAKTTLALGHRKLPSKEAAEAMKRFWSARLDALEELIG
jgi:uncharacterized protein YndB with AHSA1/START domain